MNEWDYRLNSRILGLTKAEANEMVNSYREQLKREAQQAQSEAWKLSKSDVQFLESIKIKAD